MSKEDFIKDMTCLVLKYADSYGIKIYSPIVAQAILESGWGQTKLAKEYHNYFGLKCGSKWQGKSVNLATKEEYIKGVITDIKANFRVYSDMDEGVKGYFEFINRKRYENLKGIKDPKRYLELLIEDGYATDKRYVDKCLAIIKSYNLESLERFNRKESDMFGIGKTIDPSVQTVLSIANAELGYMEKNNSNNLDDKTANAGKNNYTKYARDLYPGLQGQPWCDMFCDWCFNKAFGKSQTIKLVGPFSAYTPTSAQWFKSRKQWHNSPKVGDLIFFKNSVRICHIGIVYDVDNKNVYTIEGNTSLGNQVISNGGGVYKKQYPLNHSGIAGYGRPDYSILDTQPRYTVGWNRDDRGWWYADTGNTYIKSRWEKINKKWYYFGEDGYAYVGVKTIAGKKYIFDDTVNGEFECCLLKTDESGALGVLIVD